ncbi:MAG: hypothetical protein AAF630_14420 [Cyanobacteria bacterium P01_C01_bin.38]
MLVRFHERARCSHYESIAGKISRASKMLALRIYCWGDFTSEQDARTTNILLVRFHERARCSHYEYLILQINVPNC